MRPFITICSGPDERKRFTSTSSPDLLSLRQDWESLASLYRQFASRLGISAAGVNSATHLLAISV